MPIALLLLGGLLITAAIRGTEHDLGSLLAEDFTGSKSFLIWIAAICAVGAIGYVPVMRKPSHYMLALIIIVMLLSDKGFFAQFSSAVQSNITPLPSRPYPTGSSSGGSSSGGSSSGGSTSKGFDLGGSGSDSSSGIDIGTVAKYAALLA